MLPIPRNFKCGLLRYSNVGFRCSAWYLGMQERLPQTEANADCPGHNTRLMVSSFAAGQALVFTPGVLFLDYMGSIAVPYRLPIQNHHTEVPYRCPQAVQTCSGQYCELAHSTCKALICQPARVEGTLYAIGMLAGNACIWRLRIIDIRSYHLFFFCT